MAIGLKWPGLLFLVLALAACSSPAAAVEPVQAVQIPRIETAQAPTAQVGTAVPTRVPLVFVEPSVPEKLAAALHLPPGMARDDQASGAQAVLGTVPAALASSEWVYALAAPFPVLLDKISANDLISAWQSDSPPPFLNGQPILVSAGTRSAFSSLWGEPGKNIQTVDAAGLIDQAWGSHYAFAVIPFEEIEPRWKIISLDGQSPLDKHFDDSRYPLVVYYGWKNTGGATADLQSVPLIKTNRDALKMTLVTMTGTTAMVRRFGARMEEKGMTFPAEGGTLPWFWDADYVHISNEVSFAEDCPAANPNSETMIFCSRPEYLELLQYIHANIIELSGNHLIDWNSPAFKYTLKLYQDSRMLVYAGGNNQVEASQPLKIEHHGNKIAFLGCNPAGPSFDWAQANGSGSASCDYEWMKSQIANLKADGYLPVVTLQYFEGYTMEPTPQQKKDFDALSDAGAVIVSGSQAHFPQVMSFRGGGLVHYGLGNLFFDMMRNPPGLGSSFALGGKAPIEGVRVGMVDRHVFYDGRYINTVLYTDILEDYSQPRPLTQDERQRFLAVLFKAAGW